MRITTTFFVLLRFVVFQALHDGQLIDAYFTRSFYKHMLGQALTYEDIEGVDPGYYKNLVWMLQVRGNWFLFCCAVSWRVAI